MINGYEAIAVILIWELIHLISRKTIYPVIDRIRRVIHGRNV